jgi:hypothetical protein
MAISFGELDRPDHCRSLSSLSYAAKGFRQPWRSIPSCLSWPISALSFSNLELRPNEVR